MPRVEDFSPKRGIVADFNLDPTLGSETGKIRPCIVVSNDIYNQKLNVIQVVPILVTGEAGVGKSVVMFQVVSKLLEQGIPVLSFRVDNLNPVAHPDDIGRQLQKLPGSPAIVLASIAQKRECVLVIDQLDAVSLTSGRHPDFFERIHEIIKQASAHKNIHLLIACRKFDLDNDHRLKKLTDENGIAESININRLSHEKVKEVVTDLDLDATQLTQKQLDLLSIPLHLWLLSQIAENSNNSILYFQTAKDLYDRFWDYKPRELRKRLDRPIQWTKVIDILCDCMSSQQILSVVNPNLKLSSIC
jgi:mRNA-degrading endonuclease toxin of MazEF toxin-antitoxin module